MPAQYKNQWRVPSKSKPNNSHVVSLKMNDEYICDCWPFRKERTCSHIRAVLNGEYPAIGENLPPEPPTLYANVREVTLRDGTVLLPLCPMNDSHFLATLLHDALRLGVHWHTLKELYRLGSEITKSDVEAWVQQKGRKIYGPFVKGKGHQGFTVVPLEGTSQ